ncbi:hypothetical protein CCAX7_55600 [Capsulimonas corticalis]|uniref:Uncharacterized protein n=1 Tax=Capsulimonas corticalis TaxID=2219043 RepID=A0A402D0S9_9BACT|nr:hypothetical protein [Capsulimonas corticalis]BDI33509.1 hypothetical protein CCAX7_55600 [Capsulimonas corticalis]
MSNLWPPAPKAGQEDVTVEYLEMIIDGESLRATQPYYEKDTRNKRIILAVFYTFAPLYYLYQHKYFQAPLSVLLPQLICYGVAVPLGYLLARQIFASGKTHQPFCIRRSPRTFQIGSEPERPLLADSLFSAGRLGSKLYQLELKIPGDADRKNAQILLAIFKTPESAERAKAEIEGFLSTAHG